MKIFVHARASAVADAAFYFGGKQKLSYEPWKDVYEFVHIPLDQFRVSMGNVSFCCGAYLLEEDTFNNKEIKYSNQGITLALNVKEVVEMENSSVVSIPLDDGNILTIRERHE